MKKPSSKSRRNSRLWVKVVVAFLAGSLAVTVETTPERQLVEVKLGWRAALPKR
jgi:hypothetical protein